MLQLQHLIEQRYSVLQEFERRTTQALKHLNSKDIKSKQLNWWHFDEIINAIMSSEHERQLKEEQLLHEMHSDIIPITTNDDQFIQSSLSIMRSIDNSFVYSETPLNNNNNNLKPNTSAKIIGDLYKLFFAKQLEAKKYNSTRTMQQAGLLDQRITIAKVDIQDRSYVQIEEDKTITTADTSVSIAGGNGYDNRGNSEHEQRHNKQNDTIYPKNGNNQTQVIILSQPSLRSPSPFTQPFSTTSSVSSRSQSSSRVADILLLNSTSKSNCSSQPNGMITPSLHNNLQSNGFPRLSQPSRRLFDRTIRLMQIQKEQHRSRRAISEDNKDGSTGKNNSNNNNKQYQTTFLSESKRYGQNRLMSNGNDKSIQQVDKQIGQQQQQQQRMWMSQYSPQRRASCDNNQKGFKNNNNNNITNSSNTNISINNNNSNNTINLKAILSVYHKNYQKSMSQDENNNNNNNNNKYLNRTMTQTTATTPSNYSFHNSDCRIQLELKSLLDLDTIRNPLSSLLRRNYSSEQIQAAKTTLFNNLLMLNAHVKATQDWYYKAFNSKTKIKKNKSVTSSHSCGGIKESININIKDIDNLDNKQIEQDNQAKHDQDCYDDQEQKYNQELQLKVNQLSQQEQQEHYSVSTNNRNPIQDKIYSNNAYSWLQQQQQEPKLRRISALFDDQMRKINDSPQKFRLSLLNMKDKSKRLKGIQQECINNEQDIMISELFDSDEQQNEEQNNQEQLLTISAIPLKQLIDNDKDQMQFNARMAGRRVLSVDSCGTMIRNNYQKQSCQDNNNNNNNNSEKKSVPQQNPIILLNAPNLLHTAAVTTTTTTNNKVNNKISMNATFASNASKNQSVVNKISSTVAWNNNNNNNNSNNNNSSYNNNNKIKISALKNNNNNTNINNSNNSTTTFAHYRLSPISVTQAYYSLSPQIHDQIQSTNTASINQQNSQYPCFQSPSDQIDITKVSSLQSPLAPTTTAAPNIISQCSLAASTSNNSSRLNYISESTFRNTSTFLPRTILSNDLHSNNKKNYNNILNNASNNNSNSNSARKKRFSLQGKNNNNTNNSSMDMELIGSITKTNQSKGLSQNQDTMYLRNISSLKQQEKIEESSQNGQKINDLLVNDERNIIKDITTFNSSDNNTNKSITKHLIDEIFFNRSHSKYKNDRKNHMSKTNRSNSITNNSCNPNIGMTTPIETMINTYTGKKNKYNIDNNSSSNNNNNGQWRVNLLQQQQNKIDQTDEDNKQGSNNNNNYPQLFSNQLIKASIKLSDLDSLSYRRQIQSKWRNYSYFNHAEQQQQQQKQQQQQPSLDPIQYLNQKISKFLPNNQ